MSKDYNAPDDKAPAATKQDSAAPDKSMQGSKVPAAGVDPYTNPPKTDEPTKNEMEH
jgi:hypothetical protein